MSREDFRKVVTMFDSMINVQYDLENNNECFTDMSIVSSISAIANSIFGEFIADIILDWIGDCKSIDTIDTLFNDIYCE